VERDVRRPEELEQRRDDERVEADADLEERVHEDRVARAVNEATDQEAAERQAAHERGEDGRYGVGRDPEDQRQLARPQHFVHEPRRSREEEQDENERAGRSHGRGTIAESVSRMGARATRPLHGSTAMLVARRARTPHPARAARGRVRAGPLLVERPADADALARHPQRARVRRAQRPPHGRPARRRRARRAHRRDFPTRDTGTRSPRARRGRRHAAPRPGRHPRAHRQLVRSAREGLVPRRPGQSGGVPLCRRHHRARPGEPRARRLPRAGQGRRRHEARAASVRGRTDVHRARRASGRDPARRPSLVPALVCRAEGNARGGHAGRRRGLR
jgi:hypothetical protein